MAETTLDLRALPKAEAYQQLIEHTELVLEGMTDPIAAMATMSAFLYHGFGHFWAGFYRVVPPGSVLRVGPYQGTVGCLEIEFGRGVCGIAASERRTVIVDDVTKFPGHIACDDRSKSEIVVPVFGVDDSLIAVLDLDADHVAAFTPEDARGLEELVGWFRRSPSGRR
jgi:L-methionine (R)-S-oxide reductase